MNKLLKGMLLLALAAGSVTAKTNKTFLMSRSNNVNLPMEYTNFNELIQVNNKDHFGANIQMVDFYQEASNKSDLGKYFGVNSKNVFNLINGTNKSVTDINTYYITHDVNSSAQLKLEPEQNSCGVRIDYYQDLDQLAKGLYFKVAVPIVHVETDMNLTITCGLSKTKYNLINYFKGGYIVPDGTIDAQRGLTRAKIDGRQGSTGIADIDFVLGYKVEKEKYCFEFNAGLTIPTGDRPTGEWLFEPIVGNGKHWALGGGFDASGKLWEKEDQSIKLTGALNFRYLFESTERRTLGLKGYNWGHYYGIGKVGHNYVTPAANELTMNLDVEPGCQLDAIIYFTYNYKNWTIDLGYNLFWKDSENVYIQNWDDTSEWGLVARNDDLSTPLATGSADWESSNGGNAVTYANSFQIIKENIDIIASETPSQITHKVYGGIGHIFKDWKYPFLTSIGGSYEFANENGIENWQIWSKIGVAF